MTPKEQKEKAEELVNKMLGKNPNRQDGVSRIDFIQAKQCALVAVELALDVCDWFEVNEGTTHGQREYLLGVKQEIEKL